VETLEKEGRGLNLTWEVRQGIVSHSKPQGDFLGGGLAEGLTAEAQVVRVSDAVAYLNHDLADAFRAGVLQEDSLPREVVTALGDRHSRRIDSMVTDIVESSWALSAIEGEGPGVTPTISMSPEIREAVNVLREFMFQRVYVPEDKGEEGRSARGIVRLLHGHFSANPGEVPPEFHGPEGVDGQVVVDYVAGMTDRYAIRTAESIEPGIAGIFLDRLV
jgi:dGTPase